MVTALAVTALLKIVTGLPIGCRRLQGAVKDYFLRRARREIAAEEELWRQARWDLDAAKKLRRRLVRHAALWTTVRERVPRLFEEHPEYLPVLDQFEQRDQAKIAALDDTVRRCHGGWEQRCLTSA